MLSLSTMYVLHCLQLDAGVSEKICLSSSDETAVIVVSYAELKRCFESAFSDLLQANLTNYT